MGTSLFTFPSSVCLSIFVTGTEQATLSGDLRSWLAQEKEPEGRMLIIRSAAFDFAGKTGGVDLSKISPFHARRRDVVYFIIVISGRGRVGILFLFIFL